MRVLKIEPYLTKSELSKVMNSQKSIQNFRDWQIIHSVQENPGKTTSEIAAILCVNPENIDNKVQRYNKFGVSWKANVKHGDVNTLLTDKEKIKSITGFKWILNAISNNMIAV